MLTEELLVARAGNFTASENHRLMAGWDVETPDSNYPEYSTLRGALEMFSTKPTVGQVSKIIDPNLVSGELINRTWKIIRSETLPEGLITYAKEKAIEELFDFDPSLNFSTVHTRNGEEREVECIELLSNATGLTFTSVGEEQAHIHAQGVGCTPDGIVLDHLDLVETGAEVKCKSALEHAKLLLVNDGEDLKKNHFDHFTQVQTCMLVTGATYWLFACFNPFAKSELMKFKHVCIERDDSFIKKLSERLFKAHEVKARFMDQLLKEQEIRQSSNEKQSEAA